MNILVELSCIVYWTWTFAITWIWITNLLCSSLGKLCRYVNVRCYVYGARRTRWMMRYDKSGVDASSAKNNGFLPGVARKWGVVCSPRYINNIISSEHRHLICAYATNVVLVGDSLYYIAGNTYWCSFCVIMRKTKLNKNTTINNAANWIDTHLRCAIIDIVLKAL